jgi:hypothetical protein
VSGDYQARFYEKVPGKFRRLTLQKPVADEEETNTEEPAAQEPSADEIFGKELE